MPDAAVSLLFLLTPNEASSFGCHPHSLETCNGTGNIPALMAVSWKLGIKPKLLQRCGLLLQNYSPYIEV